MARPTTACAQTARRKVRTRSLDLLAAFISSQARTRAATRSKGPKSSPPQGEGLRQLPTYRLLRGFGNLFGGAAGTQWQDPAVRRAAFELSVPCDRIGVFVSHSWRASRWSKYLALGHCDY